MSRSRNAYEPPADAPVVNPFDRFTQGDFDDYVTGLTSKIRDALDPRRGLKSRGRDSDASFGLPRGEFMFGRSVSLGESSFAPSGQSVPRSSVEGERGDRTIEYDDEEDDPESDASDQEDQEDQEDVSRLPSKPAIAISGEGDEESPFIISDDDDNDKAGPIPEETLTPRSKAHQLLGLQGDEDDEEAEGKDGDEIEEEDEGVASSSPQPQPTSGPLNLYDDIDDLQLIGDDSVESDVVNDGEDNGFDGHADTVEGASPPWAEQVEAEDEAADEGQAHGSVHSLDEFFVADMDHLPPDLSAYGYDQPEPEMREYSGNTTNPFSQMMPSGSNSASPFPNEGMPQMLPAHNADAFTWPSHAYSDGPFSMSNLGHTNAAEEASQGSTARDESQGITYPSLSAFSTGGQVNIFESIGFHAETYRATESTFSQTSPSFDASEGTPRVHEDEVPERHDISYIGSDEQPSSALEIVHPEVVEEPHENVAPQLSEDIGSAVTPSLTPPLSPSGVTLTAPEPSLLSDDSSVGTSVPVVLEPIPHIERRISSEEFVEDIEDLTLPEEVTQELTQDVNLLPDPHRVPEPTFLGIPEGVVGLATRIVEPSVWAEPPTPSRSEDAEEGGTLQAGVESLATSEQYQSPPPLPSFTEGGTSRNPARVRWRGHYTSNPPLAETPGTELEALERGLLHPTPLEVPADTPREELSLLERPFTLSTPTQTPLLETPHEELGSLARRLVAPTPDETHAETPHEGLRTVEQSLLTGGLAMATPLNMRGALTRDSTMTEAAWSQGPIDTHVLRQATSATLTGDSYFPSQPISSPSQQASFERAETQETLDSSPRRPSPYADRSVARSMSPFSDGSPLSDNAEDVSVSKSSKPAKRASRGSRLFSSVGVVGKRELKALQDLGSPIDGPRPRRTISKQTLQTNKVPARGKGKQQASPVSRKGLPKIAIATAVRLKALRSNSVASPTVSNVSKQMSPTSTEDSDEASKVSSRDEIDLLQRVDEEEREREREEAENSDLEDEHPKKKRKRHLRVSMLGDDEGYLPEDVERSLKKRKLEAKGHDLDESLDAIDLASILEAAETNTSTTARPLTKQKNSKKREVLQVQLEELEEAESLSDDSDDRGSEFVPSPDVEQPRQALNGETQPPDAEAFSRLSPTAQAKYRKGLNPDLRAYKPSGESESSESDDEEPTKADLIADLKDVVEGIGNQAKPGDAESAIPADKEAGSTAPTKKQKKRADGARKSKKAASSVDKHEVSVGSAAEKLSELKEGDVQSRDVEMELGDDGDCNDGKPAGGAPSDGVVVSAQAPAPGQPQPQQSIAGSGWFGPFRFWRSNNPTPAPPSAPRTPPPTDRMDVD